MPGLEKAISEASNPWRIFLCHASEDSHEVKLLHSKLEGVGFQPWLSSANLLPGELWEEKIRTVLRKSDAVIVCVSKALVEKSETHYVGRELRYALRITAERRHALQVIPVRLEECDLPPALRQLHSVSLRGPGGFQPSSKPSRQSQNLNDEALRLPVRNFPPPAALSLQ